MIALAKSESRLSLAVVAKDTKMPYRFLTKIARSLMAAGLLAAKEGKGGGYQLARPPARIKLAKIFTSLGEPLAFTICHTPKGCPLKNERDCKLRPVWSKIKKDVERELDKYTLKDFI